MWGQVGRRRGARTPACRVETRLISTPALLFDTVCESCARTGRREESRRGTQECVRYVGDHLPYSGSSSFLDIRRSESHLLFRIRISRPVVRGPGVANFDFSLFKNFQPTERIGVQLRAEAFNLANRVRFGFPNQNLSSGQIGVITSQADVPARFSSA